jgi:hypothetical protein
MTESALQYEREWHLDKKVPIALILTLAFQTAAIVWWAASISARVDTLEQRTIAAAPQAERIVRLETKLDGVIDKIAEIKGLVSARRR